MDINELSFTKNHFDVIYSCGVLHHTPDPEASFLNLVKHLKPGGIISVWVYHAYNNILIKTSNFWRSVTSRLPLNGTLAFCKFLALTYKLFPEFTQELIWISRNKKYNQRVRHNFDWYSPKHQFYYTYYEVFQWFKKGGLKEDYMILTFYLCQLQ